MNQHMQSPLNKDDLQYGNKIEKRYQKYFLFKSTPPKKILQEKLFVH